MRRVVKSGRGKKVEDGECVCARGGKRKKALNGDNRV